MGLTLGSLLLVAAILELGLRVTHNEAEPRIQCNDPDLPELALRDLRKRNIRGTFKGSYYRTNSEGRRDGRTRPSPATETALFCSRLMPRARDSTSLGGLKVPAPTLEGASFADAFSLSFTRRIGS